MGLATQSSQHPFQEAGALPAFLAMRIVGDGAERDELGEGVKHFAWFESEGAVRRMYEERVRGEKWKSSERAN